MKTVKCRTCSAIKCQGDRICSGCGYGLPTQTLKVRSGHPAIAVKSHFYHALVSVKGTAS